MAYSRNALLTATSPLAQKELEVARRNALKNPFSRFKFASAAPQNTRGGFNKWCRPAHLEGGRLLINKRKSNKEKRRKDRGLHNLQGKVAPRDGTSADRTRDQTSTSNTPGESDVIGREQRSVPTKQPRIRFLPQLGSANILRKEAGEYSRRGYPWQKRRR